MARTNPLSYRALLLASVAGFTGAGAAHAGISSTVSTSVSSSATTFNLSTGDDLTVTPAGSITINTAASGYQPDVAVAASGASFVTNSGLILSNQTLSGIGIDVAAVASLGTITNTTTGTISATGTTSTGLNVAGGLTTLLNSGLVQATGSGGSAVNVVSTGNVGTITNTGPTGTIQAIGPTGVAINVQGAVNTVTNAGLVKTKAGDAVNVGTAGLIVNLTNNAGGTISAGGSGAAIDLAGAINTLVNTGVIQSNGASGIGVKVVASGNLGSLTNNPGGTIIASGAAGIAVDVFGNVTSINNSGVIQGSAVSGASPAAMQIEVSGSVATITNNVGGTIASSSFSAIGVLGTLTTLTNNGLLGATGGSLNDGVLIAGGGSIGSIVNGPFGTIQANTNGGVAIEAAGAVTTIDNSGQIQANGAGGVGIIASGSVGTLTNNLGGTISATGLGGIAVDVSNALTSLVNVGLVQGNATAVNVAGALNTLINGGLISATGATGVGINLIAGGNIGSITNTAGATISGTFAAIDESAAKAAQTINTAGTIIGAIKQGNGADVLNVTGGLITGNVVGQGTLGTVNLSLASGGTLSAGDTIVGVGTVTLNNGALILAASGGNTISGAQAFTIAAGATATVSNTVGTKLTTNSGFLNIGTNTPTLSGSYVQTGTGVLRITVAGSAIGALNVTNTATITGTSGGVALHFAGLTTLASPSTIVTTGAGLTVTPTLSALTASSDSPNPFYQLPVLSTTTNTLLLSFVPPPPSMVASALSGSFGSSTYGVSAGYAYAARLSSLGPVLGGSVLTSLLGLTPAQQAQLERQAAPRSVGTAQALLSNGLIGNDGFTAAVNGRMIASRGTDGLAAGDEVGRGVVVWAQPFGSAAEQGKKADFGGFTAATYGAAFGADTLIRPDVRIGAAVGIANSDISYTGAGSGNTDSILNAQLGVYGTWFSNGFFVDANLGAGFSWYNSKQNIAFLGQQSGNHDGSQYNVKLGAGYDWNFNGAVITPSIAFQDVHLDIGSYTMSGGLGPSANINANSVDLTQGKIGARVAYPMAQADGWVFTPEVHANYVHNFNTTGITTSGTFSGGAPFAVFAPTRDADVFNIGAGLTIAQKGPFALSGVYDYAGGETAHTHTFFLRIKTEF